MRSKNSAKITAIESVHLALVKSVACVTCNAPPPSSAHHMVQGNHWTTISWCYDCHQGPQGWHGDKSRQRVAKQTELDCLNETLRRVYGGTERHSAPKAENAKERTGNNLSSSKILPRAA